MYVHQLLLNHNNILHAHFIFRGEGFRTNAPIDCRYRYICDGPNQTPGDQGPAVPVPPVQVTPRPTFPTRPTVPIPPVPDVGNPFRPVVTDEEVPVQVLGPQDVYISPDAQDVYGSPNDNRYPQGGGYYQQESGEIPTQSIIYLYPMLSIFSTYL